MTNNRQPLEGGLAPPVASSSPQVYVGGSGVAALIGSVTIETESVYSSGMTFVKIANCWFNLSQVESIEISRTSGEDSKELYTVVISLGSGRLWSRRDVEKSVVDEYASQIEAAINGKFDPFHSSEFTLMPTKD